MKFIENFDTEIEKSNPIVYPYSKLRNDFPNKYEDSHFNRKILFFDLNGGRGFSRRRNYSEIFNTDFEGYEPNQIFMLIKSIFSDADFTYKENQNKKLFRELFPLRESHFNEIYKYLSENSENSPFDSSDQNYFEKNYFQVLNNIPNPNKSFLVNKKHLYNIIVDTENKNPFYAMISDISNDEYSFEKVLYHELKDDKTHRFFWK